jgi:hypothetical protein
MGGQAGCLMLLLAAFALAPVPTPDIPMANLHALQMFFAGV